MKTNKKRLMIDMDDVICTNLYLYLVNKFTANNYAIDDLTNYYVQDYIPEEKKKEATDFFINNNMYEHVELIKNAYEILEKLSEKYDVYILTAYVIKDNVSASGRLLKDKFDWLQSHLPFISLSNYVFTNTKDIIDCDIIIDDRLSNLLSNTNANERILFTAYHNRDINEKELKNNNVLRASDWYDIEKILL